MNTTTDEMRTEYDFSKGMRGKHYKSYRQGSNVILLDQDVAKVFKDSESVNHALRMLMEIAEQEIGKNLTNGST